VESSGRNTVKNREISIYDILLDILQTCVIIVSRKSLYNKR